MDGLPDITIVTGLARAAGDLLRERFHAAKETVETKSDGSPVTAADRDSSRLILSGLTHAFPGIPRVSEEEPIAAYDERKNWERFWIVDPLDGTKEFISGRGEFTVNIALIEGSEPVLGVVYAPVQDLMYYASKGEGTFKEGDDGRKIRLMSDTLSEPPRTAAISRSHPGEGLDELLKKVGAENTKTAGSSLKFGLLAEGEVDLYVRTSPTSEWDTAAGDCVWRDSAVEGRNPSPLTYNKPELKNPGFVLGLTEPFTL